MLEYKKAWKNEVVKKYGMAKSINSYANFKAKVEDAPSSFINSEGAWVSVLNEYFFNVFMEEEEFITEKLLGVVNVVTI